MLNIINIDGYVIYCNDKFIEELDNAVEQYIKDQQDGTIHNR